jgi:hypothetical protein
LLAVPKGKGKHAAQCLDKLLALLLIKMNDDFGVALCLKTMSFVFKLRA